MHRDENISKHAYLIIANDKFEQLYQLLKWLDDPRNDIFLHVDRKSKSANYSALASCVSKSTLYIYPDPVAVYWGDYSQIEAELRLLEYSSRTNTYAYYHLLSGKCIPIKSQNYIHSFFHENAGKEFVSIDNVNIEKYAFRYKYHHTYLRRFKNPKAHLGRLCTCISSLLQRVLGVNRIKGTGLEFKKGANWFSITHSFAQYVIAQRPWIEQTFRNTYCCDEIFLQTLLHRSEFATNRYQHPCGGESNMRYVDWKRGNPYTFQSEDAETLAQCDQLFARKVDDCEAASRIYGYCIKEERPGRYP